MAAILSRSQSVKSITVVNVLLVKINGFDFFTLGHYNNKWYINPLDVELIMFKGLRQVLEGFVVPMHEAACETGSQIPGALAGEI